MSKISLPVALLFFCACTPRNKVYNARPIELDWLVGVWKHKSKDVYEKWIKANENEYLGVEYDLIQGWANITENLKLYKVGRNWHYETRTSANPQASVVFVMTPDPVFTLKFINEKHDFPQIIAYRREAFDVMTACIGDLQGLKQECDEFLRYSAQ